ncbi:type I polyketide synthase [Aeromicrobium sp. CF3.5]|uniref:type I polyketide synthase n=1 Tax=Aeromicrobium sp. CF3.5 TaxID=3373078 RepID=UPI003EE4CBE6
MSRIVIVGMGCVYPDADSPQELWESAMSGRRAFRRIPDTRTSLADYYDPDPTTPDTFYSDRAAVLEGYEFDRLGFKIAGSTFRSTDLTHWLALDVAARALADAGFAGGDGLPRDRTGVIIGNTLTGEFSRANTLRLRWPYVRRVVAAQAREMGWDDAAVATFVDELEGRYKAPFPTIDEDSLAGGLANTIAGRICNYFDLNGGGYTVDGACSSSLLSVTTAAQQLVDGDLDAAVAGGVDLSIDPFEIVGFAKTGALARTEMKLYDEGSNGFWPGEGCGMVVLMREEDALAAGRTPLARLAGWGVSSDGAGGMTRPELNGYQLALERAYAKAGFGIETVPYFEGHGTGTPVGDDLELSAISGARRDRGATDRAAIGSVKAQIGHTKAAAGIAGLIKAVQVVRHGVIPPTIGCRRPHARFTAEDASLRPVEVAEPWPSGAPLRAGVTSMGFGGINAHVVVEGDPLGNAMVDWAQRPDMRAIGSTRQEVEVLLVAAGSMIELAERVRQVDETLRSCSYAELTDLSVAWAAAAKGTHRAAVVATSPQDAHRRWGILATYLDDEIARTRTGGSASTGAVVTEVPGAGFVGTAPAGSWLAVGLLFPGQGTGSHLRGGALSGRVPAVADLHAAVDAASLEDPVATQNAQPLTVAGSLAGLAALDSLGIRADIATGHSLGELSALAWGGVLEEQTLIETARMRGAVMAQHGLPGTMATIDASAAVVRDLLPGTDDVTVAALNSLRHTVVAGTTDAVQQLMDDAASAGLSGRRLPVSHAFHSALVRPAADVLRDELRAIELTALVPAGERTVVSTVTGGALAETEPMGPDDVRELLCRQIVDPVRFAEAVTVVADQCSLLIEVGPGRSMTQLAGANDVAVPVVSLDTDDDTLGSYLTVAAAAWVGGALSDASVLVRGRFHRPAPGTSPSFLSNPVEQVPSTTAVVLDEQPHDSKMDVLGVLIATVAERAEMPPEAIGADTRLLEDLHLSSITVGQIVATVATTVGVKEYGALNLATSTVGELADGLEAQRDRVPEERGADPLGAVGTFVGTWVELFTPAPVPVVPVADGEAGGAWVVAGSWPSDTPGDVWAEQLSGNPDGGVLLGVRSDTSREDLRETFTLARQALQLEVGQRVVFVGGNDTTTALAKSLFLEHPELRVTVIDGDGTCRTGDLVADVAATRSFMHVRYLDGVRHVPHLVPHHLPAVPDLLGADGPGISVLLASGGAKGITAECALVWAGRLGARVALVGRAPITDAEVATTLSRFAEAGLEVQYFAADLTDATQVSSTVQQIATELGPVTHLLHGAGNNRPSILENLDWSDVEETLAAKVDSLEALLSALAEVGAHNLRHLVTFGSIIGRTGLWGDAHYAMANAELSRVTRRHGEENPHCQTTCLEWSVWSDVGMGARLGAVETLTASGITAITPGDGTEIFLRATAGQVPASLVVGGRLDALPTVSVRTEQIPLGRFLDRVRRHHVGYELVTDAVLALGSDPYLTDHEIDGDLVLPAVIGLEAMAQVASAVTRETAGFQFTDVRLDHPVVVPAGHEVTVRLSAVRRVDGAVDVVLLSQDSNYSVAHFSATITTGARTDQGPGRLMKPPQDDFVELDPSTELYGSMLFQSGRFQRVLGYDSLSSTQVQGRVAGRADRWFADVLPGNLVLGDPGARDALMHANQVSVPDATLIPQHIDLLEILRTDPEGDRTFIANEILHEGTLHVYDIDVLDEQGVLVERWRGLHLRAVRHNTPPQWPTALLGPHLERVLEDAGVRASIRVGPAGGDGLPVVRASVDDSVCSVECTRGLATASTQGVLTSVLTQLNGRSADVHVEESGIVRGLTRTASGPAQAVAIEALTSQGDLLHLTIAWAPVGALVVGGGVV